VTRGEHTTNASAVLLTGLATVLSCGGSARSPATTLESAAPAPPASRPLASDERATTDAGGAASQPDDMRDARVVDSICRDAANVTPETTPRALARVATACGVEADRVRAAHTLRHTTRERVGQLDVLAANLDLVALARFEEEPKRGTTQDHTHDRDVLTSIDAAIRRAAAVLHEPRWTLADAEEQCRATGESCGEAAGAFDCGDPEKAVDLRIRGCAAEQARPVPGGIACVVATGERLTMFAAGEGPKGMALLERLCAIGYGCTDLGDAYQYGVPGVPPDLAAAAAAYRRSCESSTEDAGLACLKLRSLYAEHRGVAATDPPALDLERKVAAQAESYQAAPAQPLDSPPEQRAQWATQCAARDAVACRMEGLAYEPTEPAKAEPLYRKACHLDAKQWLYLAMFGARLRARDPARGNAVTAFAQETGCAGGDASACVERAGELELTYRFYPPMRRDLALAAKFYLRACEIDDGSRAGISPCRVAATFYREGRGVVVDAARAEALGRRADEAKARFWAKVLSDRRDRCAAEPKEEAALAQLRDELGRLEQTIEAMLPRAENRPADPAVDADLQSGAARALPRVKDLAHALRFDVLTIYE